MNETIHRDVLNNPRVLTVNLGTGTPHVPDCPHRKQELDDIELEQPSVVVDVLPTGEVVGRASKQLEKEPLHVRIDKFGSITAGD